jgi:trimethylamine--corrinoid protein Co-methyltransferase
MTLRLGNRVLDDAEIEAVVNGACRMLEKTGVRVENPDILRRLAEFGAQVDGQTMRARFSRSLLDTVLAGAARVDWEDRPVRFSAAAEIYQGYYLDPRDDGFKPWTMQRLLEYVQVARALPHVESVSMLGCPLLETPVLLQPLYEKLYAWKYGIGGGQSIWETRLCPFILDMWQVYADATGTPVADIFNGTVYLISPLKFGSVEAEQFMFFVRAGLRPRVGALGSLGGTTPVTLAGALALHLAEQLFINILERAFFDGAATLHLGNSLAVLDMATGAFQYGRPESTLLSVAAAQVARHLGAAFSAHGGLSDAKVPGNEAGMQKVSSAIFNALSYGHGHLVAGLLGVDEICSPVQLILDDHVTGALKRVAAGLAVDETAVALDLVDEVGPGGSFLATEHTARNFRGSMWLPRLWSREMYSVWNTSGRKNDVDRAKERFFQIITEGKPLETFISEETEHRLLAIIRRAAQPA